MAIITEAAIGAQRDPTTMGMQAGCAGRPPAWPRSSTRSVVGGDAGATHVAINTMNTGLGPVDGHLEVLAEVAAALELRG